MSNFKYSAKTINGMIDGTGAKKVCMRGVYDDLKKLKPVIEKLYDDHIFYLSYWKGDALYFGWSWSEDDGSMANQAMITDEITEKVQEVYALILAGLGEQCEGESK